jgi:cytochrome c biogenesis protein CcmG/thiol:disulfide interchange protein DsbE
MFDRPEDDESPVEAGASVRAGYGNRTRLSSLGSWRSTDELIPRERPSIIAARHYAEGVRRTYVSMVAVASLALVALLVYGVIGAGGSSSTLDDAVRAKERPKAPIVELPRLGEGTGSLADYAGKPVILNVWASWCEPCKEEAPVLERAHRRLQRAGGTVLGVTISDASEDSFAFMREHGMTFPSLRDVDGKLQEKLHTNGGVPETFVVDREGRIVMISRGVVDREFVDRAIGMIAQ